MIYKRYYKLGLIICYLFFGVYAFGESLTENYPDRPIKIIVPYGPGVGSDIIIRSIQNKLAQNLGQTIVIENRPGASTILGTELVAKSAPDGYTALVVDLAFLVNPSLFHKLPYDSQNDFIPVIYLASSPSIMLTSTKMSFMNLKDFVKEAKAAPTKFNYASAGFGTGGHMASEMLKVVAGIDLVHVPYKGAGPAMSDEMGGHVSTIFTTVGAAKSLIESGQMLGLAITGDKRSDTLPQVPTFTELGYAEVNANIVWGIFLPAGVPKEVVQRLNTAINSTLQSQEIKQRLSDLGFIPGGGSSNYWNNEVAKSINRWSVIVKQGNIKVE